MHENEIGTLLLKAAFAVHKELGPGLFESTYKAGMDFESTKLGLFIEREIKLPLIYKGVKLECGYKIDMRDNKKVIVEVKAVETMIPLYLSQILTYMKLSGCRLGYLINFNVANLKDGVKRVILGDL